MERRKERVDEVCVTEQVNVTAMETPQVRASPTKTRREFGGSIYRDRKTLVFWFHTRAEGTPSTPLSFSTFPKAPLDLYQADQGRSQTYRRVFIMDATPCRPVSVQYLRFVRGIIDPEDLPLNVSREILQQNKVLTSIKTASVKKILSELKNIAANDKDKYVQFIAEYNRPLKEGLYATTPTAKPCSDLVRSSPPRSPTSLAEAKERMQPEQKALYYITGGSEKQAFQPPLLEIYKKKGIEVLIPDDDIDEIVFSMGPHGDIDSEGQQIHHKR